MQSLCENPYYSKRYQVWFDCGSCPVCRTKKVKNWQIRSVHELQYYDPKQCFMITLTYNGKYLPDNNSLRYLDVQLFIKVLRDRQGYDRPIKFMCAGEYGSNHGRAHYHLLIYGLDMTPYDFNYGLNRHYKGEAWKKASVKAKNAGEKFDVPIPFQLLWGMGHVHIGNVTAKSAGYVAGYIYKKLSTLKYDASCQTPPFVQVSKGYGKRYALEHREEALARGYFTMAGSETRYAIPRYYFKLWNVSREEYYADYVYDGMTELVDFLQASTGKRIVVRSLPGMTVSDHYPEILYQLRATFDLLPYDFKSDDLNKYIVALRSLSDDRDQYVGDVFRYCELNDELLIHITDDEYAFFHRDAQDYLMKMRWSCNEKRRRKIKERLSFFT